MRKEGIHRYKRLSEHQIGRIRKETLNITIKTRNLQNKERVLKAAKEKCQVTYKDKTIRVTTDFLAQTLNARRA
jgi:hypothetical protein